VFAAAVRVNVDQPGADDHIAGQVKVRGSITIENLKNAFVFDLNTAISRRTIADGKASRPQDERRVHQWNLREAARSAFDFRSAGILT
jgi:hypothetical protein